MTAAFRTAPLAIALALTAVGCQQKNSQNTDPHAGHDHRPRPEGRIEVDQSSVLPVDVKAGVQREYPGSAVQNVQKRTEDDRVVRYEVQLKTKDGKNVTRVFDADGKPSSGNAGAAK
jgi:hypothetical protein